MVTISGKRSHRFARRRSGKVLNKEKVGAVALGCIMIGYIFFAIFISSRDGDGNHRPVMLHHGHFEDEPDHPHLRLEDPQVHEGADFFDSLAKDIINTLNCRDLLQNHRGYDSAGYKAGMDDDASRFMESGSGDAAADMQRRRRLEPEPDDDHARRGEAADDDQVWEQQGGEAGGGDQPVAEAAERFGMDDFDGDWAPYNSYISAQHLFCVAAFPADHEDVQFWKERIRCDATGTKQQALLDLWSTARAEVQVENILKKTLSLGLEQMRRLVGKKLFVWAPSEDEGTEYMVKKLSNDKDDVEENNVDYGGITGISHNLGPGKLFVDIGSGLGYTSMAVSILYPGTEIVSVEPASANWLLQEINWRCNEFGDDFGRPQVLLSGVGPSTGASQMAKFLWRPHHTGSTRPTWAHERADSDTREYNEEGSMELTVRLRPWRSIQAETGISGGEIDVLNVDCEGCEYNLIPALTDEEFDAIPTVMGEMHWGYIPSKRLPSSQRGSETHGRLCRHENFARTSIECCAFPDEPVTSSVQGEILAHEGEDGPPFKAVTVRDVAGSLCNGFTQWALEHKLDAIESDWGWFQVTE